MADAHVALEETSSLPEPRYWNFPVRVVFRFAFVYLLLYCLPCDTGRIDLLVTPLPFDTEHLKSLLKMPWSLLGTWVAVHVFVLSGPMTLPHPTGSGDTVLDYIQVFNFAFIAAVVTVIWSVLDRRRPNYNALYPWLRLVVRFTLAFTMLYYGFAKVFPLQFGSMPTKFQMTEQVGELSPMGMLWTMMASSTVYTAFCGAVEVIAGTFLLFRRTAILGALITSGAVLNIVMLNFCYDVPVKLYSLHLLAMTLFLLLPNLKTLWEFFIIQEEAKLSGVWVPPSERRALRIARLVFHLIIVVSVCYGIITSNLGLMRQLHAPPAGAAKVVDGLWERDQTSAPSNWQMVNFELGGMMIRLANGSFSYLQPAFQKDKLSFDVSNPDSRSKGVLTYQLQQSDKLILRGKIGNDPVDVTLHRIDPRKFLLVSRGFHWINEDPFNR